MLTGEPWVRWPPAARSSPMKVSPGFISAMNTAWFAWLPEFGCTLAKRQSNRRQARSMARLLGDVDEAAAGVVAAARIALRVLVGHHRALRLQHGAGDDVLGGDQLDLVALAAELALDGARRSPGRRRRGSPRRRRWTGGDGVAHAHGGLARAGSRRSRGARRVVSALPLARAGEARQDEGSSGAPIPPPLREVRATVSHHMLRLERAGGLGVQRVSGGGGPATRIRNGSPGWPPGMTR